MAELQVAMVYRLFFLWIEPIAILLGGLQAIFDPVAHLNNFTPIAVPAIRPEYIAAICQLGACELFMAGVEGLVLRVARHDLQIWRLVIGFEMIGDFIHVYGLWLTMGSSLYYPSAWRTAEYINLGMLLVALLLRPSFMLGLGVKETKRATKKKA